ncbi:MAG: hypothetical protein RIR18_842 [Pseudomonadota bacterium]
MDDLAIFRALHVAGVVLWIGGVAFVTTVLLPAIRNLKSPEERVAFFESIENKFAGQARVTTLLVGLTGFYIIYQWNLWERFLDLNFWWLHAMLAIWLLFTMMLFIAEPLFLHRWFLENAKHKPEATFQRIEWLHRGLLTVSLITLIGAVVGSHSLH